VIDYSAYVGTTVLVYKDGNSSEDVDYEGQLSSAAISQQVEGF
jgi:hypothetical protein